MEWINPKYLQLVADLRTRQAAKPMRSCPGCEGRGQKLLPASHGALSAKCQACSGVGVRPAPLRGFITT